MEPDAVGFIHAGLSRAPTFASAVLETTVRAALPHCASLVAAAVGSAPTPLATTATSAMAEVESEPLYEGALLGLLRRNDHALVAASLSALARHGSVDAVRVIRKFDLPARWDRAVRQTIDTIHERAGTPAAGGLALSSPPIQSGGLSLEGSRN